MTSFGHTAGAYLITQTPPFSKTKFNKLEMMLVLLAGNIFDADAAWCLLSGTPLGAHHLFFGHTPLMGIVYFLIFYLIFRKRVKPMVFPLIALALLLHLFLDDLSYILSLVGITAHTHPEIFWLFPFDSRRSAALEDFLVNRESYQFNIVNFMQYYIAYIPLVFLLEIFMIMSAGFIFIIKGFGAKQV